MTSAVTRGDVPLARATADVGGVGAQRAPVRVRARARLAVTDGDGKILAWVRRIVAAVVTDAHAWWLVTTEPPSLHTWWAARVPVRLPADSPALRAAWAVDHWVTGVPLRALAAALHLLAGGLGWVACHPVRRWLMFALTVATVATVALYAH